MFAHFVENGVQLWALDSTASKGLKESTQNLTSSMSSLITLKNQDVRLPQILANHHIATSPTFAGKAPKPKERNLKRKANE